MASVKVNVGRRGGDLQARREEARRAARVRREDKRERVVLGVVNLRAGPRPGDQTRAQARSNAGQTLVKRWSNDGRGVHPALHAEREGGVQRGARARRGAEDPPERRRVDEHVKGRAPGRLSGTRRLQRKRIALPGDERRGAQREVRRVERLRGAGRSWR